MNKQQKCSKKLQIKILFCFQSFNYKMYFSFKEKKSSAILQGKQKERISHLLAQTSYIFFITALFFIFSCTFFHAVTVGFVIVLSFYFQNFIINGRVERFFGFSIRKRNQSQKITTITSRNLSADVTSKRFHQIQKLSKMKGTFNV